MTKKEEEIKMKKLKALFISVVSAFKKKRYVVASSRNGLIAYDEKDYDKVVESIGYITPVEIIRFKNWDKALNYCKEHGFEYSNPYEEDSYSNAYEED